MPFKTRRQKRDAAERRLMYAQKIAFSYDLAKKEQIDKVHTISSSASSNTVKGTSTFKLTATELPHVKSDLVKILVISSLIFLLQLALWVAKS